MTFPAELSRRSWDALIIGTGMGGAVLGHALAQAGMRVLFLEKGRSHLETGALRGRFAEEFFAENERVLARAGRWTEEIADVSQTQPRRFVPLLGCGTGGSTALYGMALERFFPDDFTPRRNFPNAEETTLPEAWPISYAELRPYYQAAEQLFRVRGTADPLRRESYTSRLPPPLCPQNREMAEFFRSRGLHPYQLPMACDYERGDDRCQGFLDAGKSKNDAARICLQPALEQYGACLLDECEVLRIEADRRRVQGVICRRHGRRFRLRAKMVVLAAGALATPRLLLRSACPDWPAGLANSAGLVGANLMRHYVDLYAVYPEAHDSVAANTKQLAFNDYYAVDGQKLGTVQSFGELPPTAMLVADLEKDLRGTWSGTLLRLARPIVRQAVRRTLARSVVFATIAEDLPHADNRVRLDAGGQLAIHYRIRQDDADRIAAFRQRMATLLKPYRFRLVPQAENNERLAHACGTCRFGNDPQQSVLDPFNRAHELANLYVVDASFFPSSGGTNPSLTIAANALRVAEHLTDRLGTARNARVQPVASEAELCRV